MRQRLKRLRNRSSWRRFATLGTDADVLSGSVNLGGAYSDDMSSNGIIVTVGSSSLIEGSLILERSEARVDIGARTFIGGGTVLDSAERITVGDDVLISFDVLIFDHDSHSLLAADRLSDLAAWTQRSKLWSRIGVAPIVIESQAWIGARSIILKGVTVGRGAVVAAGSVVSKDVDPFTLVAGNPARFIKSLAETRADDI